jgi:hypothetical protein
MRTWGTAAGAERGARPLRWCWHSWRSRTLARSPGAQRCPLLRRSALLCTNAVVCIESCRFVHCGVDTSNGESSNRRISDEGRADAEQACGLH